MTESSAMGTPPQRGPRPGRTSFRSYSSTESQLRCRQPNRSGPAPVETSGPPPKLGRSATFSDTVSEARQSIKTSTDDLFLPRVHGRDVRVEAAEDQSQWQSAPLALALLPAVGGIFFHNGTSVFTDVTLLCLAAVFLNWSVRLPWDWYHSAQERARRGEEHDVLDVVGRLDTSDEPGTSEPALTREQEHEQVDLQMRGARSSFITEQARRELHRHELAALSSCFIFPFIGAWLLHTIRSHLSRPSEGLVSNYNLTIFLLAAEIRPLSHLLRLVEARTLHLQRIAESDSSRTEPNTASTIQDMSTRLEQLETHIAELRAAGIGGTTQVPPNTTNKGKEPEHSPDDFISEARKSFRSDFDAISLAVRKHEKRSALLTLKTESRLRNIESRIGLLDIPSFDPNEGNCPPSVGRSLFRRLRNIAALPWNIFWVMAMLPIQMAAWFLGGIMRLLGFNRAQTIGAVNVGAAKGNIISARQARRGNR